MNKYTLMREELQDTYGILELQNKILEIAQYLDEFCQKHQIVYYLMGGSALGAMRHGGFIPWDDDLDVFMDFKNYRKFIEVCKTELDTSRFYFQQEDSAQLPYFFSKLRMNATACIEEGWKHRKDMHQGIFVDIMCLYNAAPTKPGRIIQYYAAALLKAKAVTKSRYHTDSKLKKIQLLIAKYGVNIFTKPILIYLVRRYSNKATDTLAHIFGRAKFKNSFYPIIDFGTARYVPFEKIKLPVPQNVEDYLTRRYGPHYMQMPDEKTKALYQTHAMRWSTTRDYTELLKEETL